MFDRHARSARKRLGWLAAGAVVTATVAALAAVHEAQSTHCSGNLALPVIVAPGIAPVVQQAANSFNALTPSADGHCVQVAVTTMSGSAESASVPFAQVEPPALWIPDSSMWAQRAAAQTGTGGAYAPKLQIHAPIATTPLVLAAPETVAREYGWPTTQPTWQQILTGPTTAVVGNPTSSTEGLAAVSLIEAALGDPTRAPSPPIVAMMLQLGRSAVPDVSGQFTASGEPHVFTSTEQAVFAENRQPGHPPFVSMYPQTGTLALDFPVVRVVARTEPDGTAEAAAEFEQALRSPATAKLLTDNGFRTPDGATPAGITATQATAALPTTSAVNNVLRTWSDVNLDTRFLDVVDVSADMNGAGGSGLALARAAGTAVLTNFTDTSEIGIWVFADQLAPPNAWKEVVPVGPLGEPMGGGTRRSVLTTALRSLPSAGTGQTDLYATTLAAYQAAWQGYEPTKINAVVLMTGGHDTSTTGPDLPTLLGRLRALQQPNRVVPILAIGIGQNADMDVLRQLASATGGQAYQARTASDIDSVFVDALYRRTCQPNC